MSKNIFIVIIFSMFFASCDVKGLLLWRLNEAMTTLAIGVFISLSVAIIHRYGKKNVKSTEK